MSIVQKFGNRANDCANAAIDSHCGKKPYKIQKGVYYS